MMALTQETVHYTLNSCPGVMNKSNRVHARIQDFCQARGGGGRGPTARKQSGQCFFKSSTYFTVYRVDPMVLLQRGGGGPTSSRGWGCPKKPIELVIFQCQGGSGSPNPPLDPYVGSPDATICLQNHGLSKFK